VPQKKKQGANVPEAASRPDPYPYLHRAPTAGHSDPAAVSPCCGWSCQLPPAPLLPKPEPPSLGLTAWPKKDLQMGRKVAPLGPPEARFQVSHQAQYKTFSVFRFDIHSNVLYKYIVKIVGRI
jgi:hypothetical protein